MKRGEFNRIKKALDCMIFTSKNEEILVGKEMVIDLLSQFIDDVEVGISDVSVKRSLEWGEKKL